MRILLSIVQYPPDTNSTGWLMSQLCEGLAERGHEITVVTTLPHYEKFRIWHEYRGKLLVRDQDHGIHITRLFTYAPGKKNMANRLLSYLTFNALATAAGVFSSGRWDVALCTNGSFFTGLTGWLVGGVKQMPFIFNVQDLYPEVPVRAGQLRNRKAIALLSAIEKFMYRKAAHVTVISPFMRENLIAKGVPDEKLSVIPNFVDTDFIRPLPKHNAFARAHRLADKFVIAHAGNVGYVYDLDTMLVAASHLASAKELVFLIVGDGVAKPALEKKARELKLTNVRFLPFQSYENLPWLRAASDVQVSLHKRGADQASLPSKIYEIMASGRPLLASSDAGSEVERLVDGTQCGICVRPQDAEDLAEAILRLYRDRELREEMGMRGRRHAEANYSKQIAVARYEQLLQRVGGAHELKAAPGRGAISPFELN